MSKTPKFYDDPSRLPRYNGWYWWRESKSATPRRYYLQFEGKQATPEGDGMTVPTSLLGGEWGDAAPEPEA